MLLVVFVLPLVKYMTNLFNIGTYSHIYSHATPRYCVSYIFFLLQKHIALVYMFWQALDADVIHTIHT